MSSKYPVLPPNKIIKAMRKLGFEKNVPRKVAMLNILIIKMERYLLYQCMMKLQKEL